MSSIPGLAQWVKDLMLPYDRLAAAAPIRPLDWDLSYATGAALKSRKKEKKEERKEGEREEERLSLTHESLGTPVKNNFTIIFFPLLFKVTPATYGGSQARGQIGATAACLHHSHSNSGPEPPLTYTTAHGNARSLTH